MTDTRCAECKVQWHRHSEKTDHDFKPLIHNISVTWVSLWSVSCSVACGFKCIRGIDSKLTAELVAWIHLDQWDSGLAREFANNRGIVDLVYGD